MRSRIGFFGLTGGAGIALTALAGCGPRPNSQGTFTKAEARTALIYEANLNQGPEALRAFLVDFPKGADLHMHLSGAVYAETLIRDAAEDNACVDTVALSLTKPPCTGKLIPAKKFSGNIDRQTQLLYDKLIDALSVRSFVPTAGWSEHDQFFEVFDRTGGLKDHNGEWTDEVATRAAAQNEQYLELMVTPPFSHAAGIAHDVSWNPEPAQGDAKSFAQFRQQLLSKGLRDEVAADREEVHAAEAQRKQLEHCGTPQAAPACQVEVRFIWQVLRDLPPELVYAQTLLAFETVEASITAKDDTWVGINFVRPEDDYVAMRDYTQQMKMIGFLHTLYPDVHISLHAGELKLGLVPPEGLRFHIRQAIELAHAERIGHGVDVMYEDRPRDLLTEMVDRHVMVEINLTSNEGILGVDGDAHPFPVYRSVHVPVALSTDDEGVSRIDLTHEYVRAALDYHLRYADLKKLARTGMEHDFLPGASLWARPDDFNAPVDACKGQALGDEKPSAGCKALLDKSEKAQAQWELERRFRAFEAKFQGPGFDRLLHGQ
jgi:adenosine deaminase